jgi:hypothetical protein
VSPISLYPRGNVLTEPMPFTARDGSPWLAYIEGIAEPRTHSPEEPMLPGRRLRFDSLTESRATLQLPPGSPFLSEVQLHDLLDRAQVIPPPSTATWRPRHLLISDGWYRYWQATASERRAFLERVQRMLSAAFDWTLAFVARLAFGSDDGPDSLAEDHLREGHHPVARRRRNPRWAHRPRAK